MQAQYSSLLLRLGAKRCTLEMNPGGHFDEPMERMVKGYAKLLRYKDLLN